MVAAVLTSGCTFLNGVLDMVNSFLKLKNGP